MIFLYCVQNQCIIDKACSYSLLQNTDYEQGLFVSYCMPALYEDSMFVVRCCQGEVRKENASRSVGQGSHAHMSGEMQRYGGLNLYGLVM